MFLKKSILVVLMVLMTFGVVGCGSSDEDFTEDEGANVTSTEYVDDEQQAEEEVADAESDEDTDAESGDVTMFFTGDVMLQNCTSIYDEQGINGIISEYIEQEMCDADITMINNEFPFTNGGFPHPDKQFTFRVDPKYTSVLKDMGVNVVSLANNHALDFGIEGLFDTFTTLNSEGILYVGAGEGRERAEEAAYFKVGDRMIGILSASRVIPVPEWNIDVRQPGLFCTYDCTRLVERIQELNERCDYVVVFVHWGVEREEYPEDYQKELAKAYIDAGADLVIGNHAHVPQGIEYYDSVPIVYCMGNFIFNKDMVDTYALKVVINEDDDMSLQVIPVDTENYHTSELTGDDVQKFYNYLEGISFDVNIDENGFVSEDTAE